MELNKANLVPIRVGMILTAFLGRAVRRTCPHTRGDDPLFSERLDL